MVHGACGRHPPALGVVRSQMLLRPKSFATLLFALALALITPYARASEPLPGLINHVKRAVVVVNSFDERGKLVSQGSGFFIARDRIVTNLHVVGIAARVEVKTFDGETFAIEGLRAFDRGRDLALLQSATPAALEVTTLTLTNLLPHPGEEVFVVSNPRGSEWQVSSGHTLALWESQELGALLPITAAVSRGSSGGPVVNLHGHVVGIATLNIKRTEEFHLAVPGECAAALRPSALITFPLLPAH